MSKNYATPPAMVIDPKKKYTATFKTEQGDFVVELFADKVPNTFNNFVSLAQEKFYDGVTFHRVIKGFMAQGGDPSTDERIDIVAERVGYPDVTHFIRLFRRLVGQTPAAFRREKRAR